MTTIILLTQGELGGNVEVRKTEFNLAMQFWNFDNVKLNFPDMKLVYFPLEKMVDSVTKVVADKNITILVSFNPYEITPGFDHPDHNRAGEVTRLVSVGMKRKRKLILWNSRGKTYLTIERDKYAKRFYPSQKIPIKILKNIGESYLKIR